MKVSHEIMFKASIRESRDEYHAKQLNFKTPFYELRVKEQPEWISLA